MAYRLPVLTPLCRLRWIAVVTCLCCGWVVSANAQTPTQTALAVTPTKGTPVIASQPPPGFENVPGAEQVKPTSPSQPVITSQPPPGFENVPGAVASPPAAGAEPAITLPPPVGFEEMSKPEETQVDVFFGGVKLGSYPATYDQKTIHFKDSAPIVEKIPHLQLSATPDIVAALNKPLDTHFSAHCPKEIIAQQLSCGSLLPDVAEVIFYDDTFKVDLFINPRFLTLQDTRLGVKLPPSNTGFSGVHSFNGTVSSSQGTDNFSLLQNSILSDGQKRFNFSSVINQDQSYLDTAAFGMDRGGYLSRVGFFDTGHFQTLPQTRLAGVSIETSFDTNLDLKQTVGNQLTIYLPKRAWVTLLRGKTTYSSDFYEAGNQIIDTSQLPDGAYDLTLQINEGSGTTREEKRFYAKNFNIPPSNVPIYYFQAGLMRDETALTTLPKVSDQQVVVAGTTRRLTKSTGANIGIMHTNDNDFVESTLYGIFPYNNQISIGGLASRDGDFGASASYIGTGFDNKLGFSANMRRIWAAQDDTLLIPTANTSPVAYNPTDAWQASSTISYQIFDPVSLNFQYNETANGSLARTRSYGPYVRWNLWQRNEASVMLFADANHTDTADTASVYLRFFYRFGKWGISADGGSRYNKDKTAPTIGKSAADDGYAPYGNSRLSWSDTDDPSKLINAGLEYGRDQNAENERADLDYRTQAGRLKLDLARSSQNNVTTNTGIGSFGLNVLQSGTSFAVGGQREERSGLIIKAAKPPATQSSEKQPDLGAKVTVNGSDVGVIKPGSSLPILLNPYETYKVSAQPINSDIPVEIVTQTKDITLYPGNVAPVSLDIQRIYIVIGHVVDEHGAPLANARMQQARGLVITDEEGNFQAEVTNPQSLEFTYEDAPPPTAPSALLQTAYFPGPNQMGPFKPNDMYNPAGVYNAPVETRPLDGSPLLQPTEKAEISPAQLTTAPTDNTSPATPPPSASPPAQLATNAVDADIPDEPNRIIPENTPQWVRDAAKLKSSDPMQKHRCTVTIPNYEDRNGVVIFKDALTCIKTP